MQLLISDKIARKLKERHNVTEREVFECFRNRTKRPLVDDREEHRTDPPTQWFISETDAGRRLKVVYIRLNANDFVIRSTYEPNAEEERIYQRTV